MYAQYGNYTHSAANMNMANLVSMEQVQLYSESRNKRYAVRYILRVGGDLIASTQAGINTLIGGLVDAYSENGKSWTLFHDDGTPTRHCLDQNHGNALSDVQVMQRSWPIGDAAEYATGRRFSIVLGQTLAAEETGLVGFAEWITVLGAGGVSTICVPSPFGTIPYSQQIFTSTPVGIEQEGFAIGSAGWPSIYVPGPIYPGNELIMHRKMVYHRPEFKGRGYCNYKQTWLYRMLLPALAFPVSPATPAYTQGMAASAGIVWARNQG